MPSTSAQDYSILVKIEEEKPKHVVIAITGGGQEKLALYLRDYLLYRPSIHCIGAALGFLSGEEKPIPRMGRAQPTRLALPPVRATAGDFPPHRHRLHARPDFQISLRIAAASKTLGRRVKKVERLK